MDLANDFKEILRHNTGGNRVIKKGSRKVTGRGGGYDPF